MNTKPIIKASSVTNLADARYFASYGIEIMGFCFDPKASDFVTPYKMHEISGWIEGPQLAGEFGHLSVDAIIETIKTEQLEYAQIKLSDITKQHAAIDMVPLILEIDILPETDFKKTEKILAQVYSANDFVLLNSLRLNDKQLGESPVSDFIKKMCSKYPVLIQHYFSAENVQCIIHKFNPEGIALKGSSEIKTGTKTYDEMNALMEALQQKF
jgi:phosphoribosylanthranilate isomerase